MTHAEIVAEVEAALRNAGEADMVVEALLEDATKPGDRWPSVRAVGVARVVIRMALPGEKLPPVRHWGEGEQA